MSGDCNEVNSIIEISPMVFCASLAPWPRLNAADDMSCSFLKILSVFFLLAFLNMRIIRHMKKNPRIIPRIGVRMVNATIIKMPFDTNADEQIRGAVLVNAGLRENTAKLFAVKQNIVDPFDPRCYVWALLSIARHTATAAAQVSV
mgnify:CR=1 FL=1